MMPWLAHMLVATTLLMLLVLALRRPVAQAFGARVAYALWLLPALRTVLPALPGGWRLLPGPEVAPVAPVLPPEAIAAPLPPELAPMPLPDAQAWSWSVPLAAAWLAGALLFFGWQMARYRRFVAHALAGADRLGRECGVDVLLSDHVEGPVAAGVLRRRIFLPRDFTRRYNAAERRQALLHEGAHHDRHDLLANLAGLAVLALHWWNPVAHLAYRAFRSDQELACDATVLAQADGEARYAYGSALVKSACARTPAAACALDPATEIKRRLRMIGRARLPRALRLAGAALVTAAIGGSLAATASTRAPAPVDPADLPAIAPPAPPPAPAAPLPLVVPVPRVVVVPPVPARDVDTARRAADVAAGRARRAAEQARRAGVAARIAGDQARRTAFMSAETAERTRASLERARAEMAARCAAGGHPMRADERDWHRLATCDKDAYRAEVRQALEAARAQLDERTLHRRELERARDALDRAMRRFEGAELRVRPLPGSTDRTSIACDLPVARAHQLSLA